MPNRARLGGASGITARRNPSYAGSHDTQYLAACVFGARRLMVAALVRGHSMRSTRRDQLDCKQLTIDYYRRQRYIVGDVEFTARYPRANGRWRTVKRDLWGFVDIIAVRPDEILFVQATSWAHVADHRRKILDDCTATAFALVSGGHRLIVVGWKLDDGGRPIARECTIDAADFAEKGLTA